LGLHHVPTQDAAARVFTPLYFCFIATMDSVLLHKKVKGKMQRRGLKKIKKLKSSGLSSTFKIPTVGRIQMMSLVIGCNNAHSRNG
jgi:hypothetical protein